ncbi:MAG TPA: hypothetical protein PKU80_05880 [Candidatus Limiplasma sp.]|nr:hypothetical protein [Candidatus Limiplasma sp.]HRX08912.1 hypothetical protein [Candidatus Limiplasma sp.]
MNQIEYQRRLQAQGVPEAEIRQKLCAVQAFETWLAGQRLRLEDAAEAEVRQYARHLIGMPHNTTETYDALSEYAAVNGLRALYVAFLEVTDCYGAMEMLRDTIQAQHGTAIRDQIFTEPIPPLGADEAERFAYTKQINERMNALLTKEQCRAAWFEVQHGLPKAFWKAYDDKQRETFGACTSPDELVDALVGDRCTMIKRMHDENRLWYTQEVTGDAMRYLLDTPYLQMGEHNGRRGIVVTKVPYQTHQALHAADDRMKRYYTCHCPLIREAIWKGETLSDDVCYCSLGHASHYLAGIGLDTLEGEVLESAVKGDPRCRFIFYLPEET